MRGEGAGVGAGGAEGGPVGGGEREVVLNVMHAG